MEPICSSCGETCGDRYDYFQKLFKEGKPNWEIKKELNIQNDCTVKSLMTYVEIPHDIINQHSAFHKQRSNTKDDS